MWREMVSPVVVFYFIGTILATSPASASQEPEPLNVYFFARTVRERLPESAIRAREKELKAKNKEAKSTRQELEKKFKSRHGKDRDEWPEEVQEEYRLAKEAETVAEFELSYLRGAFAQGENLHGMLQEVTRAASQKDWISLVHDREQGQLLVEIMDRRRDERYSGATQYFVAVRIIPSETLISNRLGEIGPKRTPWWRLSGSANPLHQFREEEPYWIIECKTEFELAEYLIDMGQGWRPAAFYVAETIDEFIKDNRDVLVGAASPQ